MRPVEPTQSHQMMYDVDPMIYGDDAPGGDDHTTPPNKDNIPGGPGGDDTIPSDDIVIDPMIMEMMQPHQMKMMFLAETIKSHQMMYTP